MKLSRGFVVGMVSLSLLSGCMEPSANSYSSDQTRRISRVQSGTIKNIRYVTIEGNMGIGAATGAVIGGAAAASTLGRGSGRWVTGALGALAGGAAGAAIQKKTTTKQGCELTIRLDSRQTISIVQACNVGFVIGQRVDVISTGGTSRVVPSEY